MRVQRYRRARLCRLCEGPIVDGGVLVVLKRNMDKVRRWWKAHLDTEYTKKQFRVCYFCAWDLRFADENSAEKEPVDQAWWRCKQNNKPKWKNATNYYKYYRDELTKTCYVKIAPISKTLASDAKEKPEKGVGQKHHCIYCPKTFNCYFSLTSHAKSVHPEEAIRCEKRRCRMFFHTLEEKLKHVKKKHPLQPSGMKCVYCEKVCISENILNYHLLKRHKGRVIKCSFQPCKLMFKSEEERDQHFDKEHNIGKFFCCFCDRYFELNNLQLTHMKKYHKEALKCNEARNCPNYFKTEEERQKHIQEKHSEEKRKECVYCSQLIKPNHMSQHVNNMHKNIAIKCEFKKCATYFKSEGQRQKHFEEIHGKHKFFCIYCDKMIFYKSKFTAHLNMFHSEDDIVRCDYKNCVSYFITEQEKLAHTKEVHVSSARTVCCIYCNKFVAKAKGGLRQHVRKLHSDVFIQCNFHQNCAEYFKTAEEREKHVKEVHLAEKIRKPFPCLYCDKSSASLDSFKSHVKLKHLDVAIKCPYSCCGQFFKSKGDLEKHFEQKPKHKVQKISLNKSTETFSCSLCPKAYPSKSSLNQHKRIAHDKNGEKCPHCQKSFFNKSQHVISDFCRICKTKFMCLGLLRTHSIKCKQTYCCPVCAKTFKHKYLLRNHCENKHTAHIEQWRGLKYKSLGFKCDECFVYFQTKANISRHIKEVHAFPESTCHFCERKFTKKWQIRSHIVKHLQLAGSGV